MGLKGIQENNVGFYTFAHDPVMTVIISLKQKNKVTEKPIHQSKKKETATGHYNQTRKKYKI